MAHLAHPSEVRCWLLVLGACLLGQRDLPNIHTWLLQYPRDSRILSDLLGIYGRPVSSKSCSNWKRFRAEYRFAGSRINPFAIPRSECGSFCWSRFGSLTVSRDYQVSTEGRSILEGQRRDIHINTHDFACSNDFDTKLPG